MAHNSFELMRRTISQNLCALTENTRQSFDVILIIDGFDKVNLEPILPDIRRWGIDEVRLRSRTRNTATGDPSNNGHLRLFTERSTYLLTLEQDVAMFKIDSDFDVLTAIRELFERHTQLKLATRIDDHDCWCWKLKDVAPAFEDGVRSVNRVSSHFLAYHVPRFMHQVGGRIRDDIFYDGGNRWMNYEDYLSRTFAQPGGPGIAFAESWPIRVYHCDRKIHPESVFYTQDEIVQLSVFDERKAYVESLEGNYNRPK